MDSPPSRTGLLTDGPRTWRACLIIQPSRPPPLLIHSLVMGFIDHFAALKDVAHKGVTHREAPRYLLWSADLQVERYGRIDSTSDLDGLSVRSFMRPSDKNN